VSGYRSSAPPSGCADSAFGRRQAGGLRRRNGHDLDDLGARPISGGSAGAVESGDDQPAGSGSYRVEGPSAARDSGVEPPGLSRVKPTAGASLPIAATKSCGGRSNAFRSRRIIPTGK